MKKILLLLLGSCAIPLYAQEEKSFQLYDEISEEAVVASEAGDFSKTVEILDKVNKNDSMHFTSLVSKSYYLLQLERFDEAIKLIDEVLESNKTQNLHSFYTNKAYAYNRLGNSAKAIETYRQGLEEYPVSAPMLVNLAIVLEESGKIEEALKIYKKAIIINPLEKKAHIRLGQLAYGQQKMAQALMAFDMALLLDPDGANSFSILKSLNELVSKRNENQPDGDIIISKDEDLFQELDLILNNKLALNDNYKVDTDIPISLTKQNHLLIEQLMNIDKEEGFWTDIYLPLYKWIKESDNFELFTQTISYSIENPDFKRVVNRNTEDIKGFIEAYMGQWIEILQEKSHLYLNENGASVAYTGSRLDGLGKLQDGEPVGEWIYFSEEGKLAGKGNYNEKGERDKTWSWYHDNGKLKETGEYNNGEVNGKNLHFYDDGKRYIIANLENDKLNGEYLVYNENGALVQKKNFKDGELDGSLTTYFNLGEEYPEVTASYVKGKTEGEAHEYYVDERIYTEMFFKNGVKEGLEKSYYHNGNVYFELGFKEGKKHGNYKEYTLNGELFQEGLFEEGKEEGEWRTYHQNGKLATIVNYEDGEADGLYQEFDTDGKLYYEYDYRKGEIIAYRFFSKDNELVKDERKKGGEFYYRSLTPYGDKNSEGLYDISGGRKGDWKFYNENGFLEETGNYVEDLAQGKILNYFISGEISSDINFEKGLKDGYAEFYYPDGSIQSHGKYKDDLKQGSWKEYYINGTLKSESFYHKDNINGDQVVYSADGRIYRTHNYEFGELEYSVHYGPTGKAFDTIDYHNDKADYVLSEVYPFGEKQNSMEYLYGLKHGEFKSFDVQGNLKISGNYFNNLFNGTWKWYDDKGNITLEENYVYGSKHGKRIAYYENGQIDTESNFNYGLEQGVTYSFHENGNVAVETPHILDLEHGAKKFYDNEGHLQQVRYYNNGRIIGFSYPDNTGEVKPMLPLNSESGELITYYKNGQISRSTELISGEFHGDYKTYYFSGSLMENTPYEYGFINGLNVEYFENGNMETETNYLYGNLHGARIEYYSNGKIKSETEYKNDLEIGPAIYYNEAGEVVKKEEYFNGDLIKVETFAG
ncbi:tetratricopeptide repeat protein [Gramella lutea]|uniref:Tetratricopeptide repeat protein n=1 Tax=Christiangramia lutea TaxID=1607951 RepID=A0A9X2ACN1_9FLAO|nr:tetratricopeptide repeat protein [Christiangramia lutea]MCH4824248.1 tetratricopeptide repeat protein [Christiangramia lutea]